MATNCTACGHKPDPNTKYGDPALAPVTYYMAENLRMVSKEVYLCRLCVTLVNTAVHRKITELQEQSMGATA